MGFEFLKKHGAQRVRDFDPQPLLIGDGTPMTANEDEQVGLNYECAPDQWKPRPIHDAVLDESFRPRRFIDGKDVGRTVAWLRGREGIPVPVRLSEIGALAMRAVQNEWGECEFRRDWHRVERVVTLVADLFPWDEVEEFSIALRENGFRLLPCQIPGAHRVEEEADGRGGNRPLDLNLLFDFERMRRATQNRSSYEMLHREREALACCPHEPTVVDGRLAPRAGAFSPGAAHIVGVVKHHEKNYLHPQGWRTFYDLEPGERTPAFSLEDKRLSVVTWYLRLDGARGEMPNYGVVRAEIARPFFEASGGRFNMLDGISRMLCNYRCRDESYGRAAVSLHPIQRTEQSLGALFTASDTLVSRFYRLAQL